MPPKKDEQRAAAAVEERRLRTVYDFFDNSDYKRALQECDKAIKKYADKLGPTVIALKALALTKLSRNSDANKLIDELLKSPAAAAAAADQVCFEEATLSPLAIALRDLGRTAEIIPLYESACRRSPGSEDLLNSLFMLYVREQDRTRAKTIALQLHKLTDKRTYYFTAVMHQYLSGKETNDQRQRTMCFTLAEKMLERVQPTADAELNLHYMNLRDAGKTGEALDFLDKHADKFAVIHAPEERWSLLERTQAWSKAAAEAECRFAKSQCSDHGWLGRRFEIGEHNGESVEQVAAKLIEMIDAVKDHDKRRETLINRVLVYKRLDNFGEMEKLIVRFFQLFDGKIWCTADLVFLVGQIPEDKRPSLVSKLSEVAGANASSSLPWLTIDFEFGGGAAQQSDDQQQKLIDDLCEKYRAGPDLERSSDTNPYDSYLELATDIAVERFKKHGDEATLLKIMSLLELAKHRSPNGFRLKLRLLWCYCALNAGIKVVSMCDSLNVKYLQWESMGHLITPFVVRSSFGAVQPLYRRILALHTSSQKDIAEGIVACYKFGSFDKVEEMEGLKLRLENSFELASAKVMRALMACSVERVQHAEDTNASRNKNSASAATGSAMPRPEDILLPTLDWDQLQDNADMKVLPERYHYILADFATKKRELKIRWLVLNLLIDAIKGSTSPSDQSVAGSRQQLAEEVATKLPTNGLAKDLNNVVEFFSAPLAALAANSSDGGSDFEKLLAERTSSVTSIELKSLGQLSTFVICSFEWVLALVCLAVYACATKQQQSIKKAIAEQVAKMQNIAFTGALESDALFDGADDSLKKSLRDDLDVAWSASLLVLKGAEKLLLKK